MKKSLLLAMIISANVLFAQTPELLKDINSFLEGLQILGTPVSDGSKAYFIADDVIEGYEVWVTDGTEGGTMMLSKTTGIRTNDYEFMLIGTQLFFVANDDEIDNNWELWTSDGTVAGTKMLKDLNVAGRGDPTNFVNVNGVLYFNAFDGLYKSDGTTGGTIKIEAIPSSSMVEYKGDIYFGAGVNLYITDGTVSNASGLLTNNGLASINNLVVYNDTLYFTADDGTIFGASKLFKTAGDSASTEELYYSIAGPTFGPEDPTKLTVLNNKLIFTATGFTSGQGDGRELWSTTGTTNSTNMFKDIWPANSENSNPDDFTVIGTKMFLTAYDAFDGKRKFYVTDGTNGGTISLYPTAGNTVHDLIAFNGKCYAIEPGILLESDGTVVGTKTIALPNPDEPSGGFSPTMVFNINSTLIGLNSSGNLSPLLPYATDLTNVIKLEDLNGRTNGSGITDLLPSSNGLLFTAYNGYGTRLYTTQGLSWKTWILDDDGAGNNNKLSSFGKHKVINSKDYVWEGNKLYETDGSASGTVLKYKAASQLSSISSQYEIIGTDLYFSAYDNMIGSRWVYHVDLTDTANTTGIELVNGSVLEMVNFNDTLYYTDNDNMWKHMGGTTFDTLVSTYAVSDMQIIGSTLYFSTYNSAFSGQDAWQLYKTNGTKSGLIPIDAANGNVSFRPEYLANLNGTLIMNASTDTTGWELWSSDGTTANTIMLKDIYPGAFDGTATTLVTPNSFYISGNTMYFSGYDTINGNELWKTDGTPGGTAQLKDIYIGKNSSLAQNFAEASGEIFFTAKDSANGRELWKTDGTPGGTVLVYDLLPGVESGCTEFPSSYQKEVTSYNNEIYYIARDDVSGYELWKIGDVAASIPTRVADDNFTLSVYPNPNTGNFSIKINKDMFEDNSNVTCSVYNVLGKVVHNESLKITTNIIDVKMDNISKGIYFIDLSDFNKHYTQKIIIE